MSKIDTNSIILESEIEKKVDSVICQLVIGFLASIPALLLALWVERRRLPKLVISTSERLHSDMTYPTEHPDRAGQRWKYFRVVVKNRPFPLIFRWIPRQTAENCTARIDFEKADASQSRRTMLGRWTNTPDLAYLGHLIILKLLYPDPVSIPVNQEELLDIIVKYENDKEAFGWNHESYIHDWRNVAYKLDRGDYVVTITISTLNGVSFQQKFKLRVADTIEGTQVTE